MTQFDELAKAAVQPSQYPQGQEATAVYQGLPREPPNAPREMHLTERVMTHEQRIAFLEQQNAETRGALEKLAKLIVDQLGLVIR